MTQDREPIFDDAALRAIAENCWRWLDKQHEHVSLDTFVVMPNHLHGILTLVGHKCRGGSRTAPTGRPKNLGRLIGAFKTISTQRINDARNTSGVLVWQRNYYEHVVRNEDDLIRTRQYIIDNPNNWFDDEENPANQR